MRRGGGEAVGQPGRNKPRFGLILFFVLLFSSYWLSLFVLVRTLGT